MLGPQVPHLQNREDNASLPGRARVCAGPAPRLQHNRFLRAGVGAAGVSLSGRGLTPGTMGLSFPRTERRTRLDP